MRSIKRTLLSWILGAMTLGALVVALVTYVVTLEEMHEVFDANLEHVAAALAAIQPVAQGHANAEKSMTPTPGTKEEYEIATLTWTVDGRLVFSSNSHLTLPFSRVEGLSRPLVNDKEWVVYTRVTEAGSAQAAQRMSARQEMAGQSAGKLFPPLIVLVLITGGLLVFGLRRGLAPLDVAARSVTARTAFSLEPITLADVPQEVSPLVQAINGLMGRLSLAFGAQRRFLADAAHELRTPIAALRLQLQLLESAKDENQRRAALADLGAGIDRSQRLIEQLLLIERSAPDGQPLRLGRMDLAALVRSTVAASSLQAEKLGLDLGARADVPVMVEGDESQLAVLLTNLVGNALRYTQPGGTVDVVATQVGARPVLRVVDNGPGIPHTERERAFDRFYRCEAAHAQARDASGSGLGLAIVKAIAERHGATVLLKDPPSAQGLEVEVTFLAPSSEA